MTLLLAIVPAGTFSQRLVAVTDIAREAIIADALGRASGSRTRAAELIGTEQERVTAAVRRYPWLALRWPAKPGRPTIAVEETVTSTDDSPRT